MMMQLYDLTTVTTVAFEQYCLQHHQLGTDMNVAFRQHDNVHILTFITTA